MNSVSAISMLHGARAISTYPGSSRANRPPTMANSRTATVKMMKRMPAASGPGLATAQATQDIDGRGDVRQLPRQPDVEQLVDLGHGALDPRVFAVEVFAQPAARGREVLAIGADVALQERLLG